MKKLTALFLITRPVNFLITFGVIATGYVISSDGPVSLFILISVSLSGALTAASGNIVNDIFDIESDKINHPNRPLASSRISYNAAKFIWFLLTLSSFIISSLVSLYAFMAILVVHILLILYSFRLKSTLFAGNMLIALLTSAAFMYGGFAGDNPEKTVIPAIFAFLITYIREFIKDMQDVKGDLMTGTVTFPGKYGMNYSRRIIFVFIILLLLFTMYPFLTEIFKIEFFIIMMLIVNPLLIYILKLMKSSNDNEKLNRISGILKFNMVVGLLAIYLGL
jgi:geranylgeranylglycerol-phosphate geranylgeranyltransferase